MAMATVLSPADVDRIAALARLELTDEERTRFATQLSAILGYADQVQQADTSGVSADPSTLPVARLRDDDLAPSLDRGEVLGQAPAADRTAGLFKVPRVLGS
jgi:aspartyl-tRNA(Asn)/glutamyl-tRNA(Gln) amidotransferase subunit C